MAPAVTGMVEVGRDQGLAGLDDLLVAVGSLNRYGQTQPVEVVTVRNPSTVESRIWGKLEEKLVHIVKALGHAMDEPEDLMQMVLGMAGQSFFNELFSEGQRIDKSRFDQWFDAKAGTLGGRSALFTRTVTDLE